jgi:predicted Rossmann-fold nucleotide-binding protein
VRKFSSAFHLPSLPASFFSFFFNLLLSTFFQGFHTKPVGILNISGFFDHLLAFMDHATKEGFIRQASRDIILSDAEPAALIEKLSAYKAPPSLIRLASQGKLNDTERG